MNEILSFWAQWLRPSAGLPTVQWSLLLAVATVAGYVCQRHIGLPKVVGYSLVGTVAGLAGYSAAHSGEVLSLTRALPWWHFRTARLRQAHDGICNPGIEQRICQHQYLIPLLESKRALKIFKRSKVIFSSCDLRVKSGRQTNQGIV